MPDDADVDIWWNRAPWNGLNSPTLTANGLFEACLKRKRLRELVTMCDALTHLLSPEAADEPVRRVLVRPTERRRVGRRSSDR